GRQESSSAGKPPLQYLRSCWRDGDGLIAACTGRNRPGLEQVDLIAGNRALDIERHLVLRFQPPGNVCDSGGLLHSQRWPGSKISRHSRLANAAMTLAVWDDHDLLGADVVRRDRPIRIHDDRVRRDETTDDRLA